MFPIPLLVVSSVFFPSLVSGFSFNINNTPQQCQNLSISITGSGGQAPYTALIVPFGASPLFNNTEVRRIMTKAFDGTSTTLSFQLNYPENSQFVVVVSDSTGFGTGGTSVAAQVQTGSSDSSCFNATQQVSPDFAFSIVPANQLVQCADTRVWWDPTVVQGTPQFYGVIPGGQSFQIQEGSLSTVATEGVGFDWIVPVRVGTTVMIVGGDDRGIGTAGSSTLTVQAGTSGVNNTCLTDSSPSSTAGTPAGGSYPTNSQGSSTTGSGGGNNTSSNSGSSGSNSGAIIGGAVGGGLALISALIIALFFLRRKRTHNTKTVDLLQGDAEDPPPNGRSELPQFYQPEPFLVPDPTVRSSSYYDDGSFNDTYDGHRRHSSHTSMTTDFRRSGTPDLQGGFGVGSTGGSSHTRKSPLGPQHLRPVNIIQHDDAGPEMDTTQETIELPPAYNNIRKPLLDAVVNNEHDDTTTTATTDNATNPRSST
jgi:hypothetical protein